MKLSKLFLIPAVAMVYLASDQKVQAVASNNPPPVGNVIIDLDGTPIPHAAYVQYSANFLATDTSTAFSIAMREDPAFILLDDVSVTDLTTPSGELLVNGGFESGILGNNAPVGWTYLNTFGAAFAGVVANTAGQAHTGSFFYFDGGLLNDVRVNNRGLAGSKTVDFLETTLPLDTYNTGRFDVSSGPNSVLFGFGSAGGMVNAQTRAADLRRTERHGKEGGEGETLADR